MGRSISKSFCQEKKRWVCLAFISKTVRSIIKCTHTTLCKSNTWLEGILIESLLLIGGQKGKHAEQRQMDGGMEYEDVSKSG